MKKWIMIFLGFILGTAAYAIGFAVCGILGNLLVELMIFVPPAIDLTQVGLTSSALGANILATLVFSKITREDSAMPNLAFAIYLIVIAAVYLAAAILFRELHLLWYPILSFIANGFFIKQIIDSLKSTEQAQSINSDTQ